MSDADEPMQANPCPATCAERHRPQWPPIASRTPPRFVYDVIGLNFGQPGAPPAFRYAVTELLISAGTISDPIFPNTVATQMLDESTGLMTATDHIGASAFPLCQRA